MSRRTRIRIRLRRRLSRRRVFVTRGGIARERACILFGGARRSRGMARLWTLVVLAAVMGGAAVALADHEHPPAAEPQAHATPAPPPADDDGQAPAWRDDDHDRRLIAWRRSRSLGRPWAGRLVRGVRLPAEGPTWFTWDPALDRSPNRPWRRWGSDALIRTVLTILREFRSAHPDAPRVGIGDLSRPHGGWFGREYGGLGHASHQNGLDVDVYYPRRDAVERAPFRPAQVDRALAQELVDRFVEAGAVKVFVGPALRLRGPRGVVVPLVHHDNHLHVRIPAPPG